MKEQIKNINNLIPIKIKRYILAAVLVALASQFYIDILIENFRVSCGIIALGIVSYTYRENNQLLVGFSSGVAVLAWRTFMLAFRGALSFELVKTYSIEIYFYTLLGAMIYLYMRQKKSISISQFALAMIAFDFLTNLVEIIIRLSFETGSFYRDIILYLFLTAVIRSLSIYVLVNVLSYYKRLLKAVEHEERYKKLLWVNSKLETEMYWMNKNMDKIEMIMTQSYGLYMELKREDDTRDYSNRMLEITKDIHEVKKDHELVLRGIENIIENKYKGSGMLISEILELLDGKMKQEISHRNMNVEFRIDRSIDFYTKKHFQLMSVLRNFLNNGLDAMGGSKGKLITCKIYEALDDYVIEVADTGVGIKKEKIDLVFNPGYSTKIDYDTGEVNRGLGLSVVKYIVEEHFNGRVVVESTLSQGTVFKVLLDKSKVED